MKWRPKHIVLPVQRMAGCPWNIVDARGVRIAWAGGPDCSESLQKAFADDLLNLVALAEASGDLLEEGHARIQKLEAGCKALHSMLKELEYAGTDETSGLSVCPCCGQYPVDMQLPHHGGTPHLPGCRLEALLRSVENGQ